MWWVGEGRKFAVLLGPPRVVVTSGLGFVKFTGAVNLYETDTGRLAHTIAVEADDIAFLKPSPNGRCLATVVHDEHGAELRLADLESGNNWSHRLPPGTHQPSAVVTPARQVVVSSSYPDVKPPEGQGRVAYWDVRRGREAASFPSKGIGCFRVSEDGTTVLTLDDGVGLTLSRVGVPRRRTLMRFPMKHGARMGLSNDGGVAYAIPFAEPGYADPGDARDEWNDVFAIALKPLQVWDGRTGEKLLEGRLSARASSIRTAISQDGRWLLLSLNEKPGRGVPVLWAYDIQARGQAWKAVGLSLLGQDFASGQVVGVRDNRLVRADLETGLEVELNVPPERHDARRCPPRFTRNGRLWARLSVPSSTLRLRRWGHWPPWSRGLDEAELICAFDPDQTRPAFTLVFTDLASYLPAPDGSSLLTVHLGSEHQQVRLYDAGPAAVWHFITAALSAVAGFGFLIAAAWPGKKQPSPTPTEQPPDGP
jgi:hypothetical protein